MSCSVMGLPAVPDAPPPEERSSRAHNARAAARACPPARCGGAVPSTVDVMICHEGTVRCHGMSCSVMRAAGNVMFCHAGPLPPGCRRGAPPGLRRELRRGSVAVMRASFQAKAGTGVSLFRASSRGRARGAAGGRIAAARLVRLIARARRQTHLARPFPPGSFSRPQPSLSAETPKGGPGSRLSLLSFYTIPPNVKPLQEQKEKIPDSFLQPVESAG